MTEHAIEHIQAASGRGDECEESRQTAGLTSFLSKAEQTIVASTTQYARERPAKLTHLVIWHPFPCCSDAMEDLKVKTEQCIWQISPGEAKHGRQKDLMPNHSPRWVHIHFSHGFVSKHIRKILKTRIYPKPQNG